MSAVAWAEQPGPDYTFSRRPHPKATVSKTVPAEDQYGPVLAEIELRPSWNHSEEHFFAVNYAELGARFSQTFSMSYHQEFINELSQYGSKQNDPFHFFDGYLRTKVNRIWVDKKSDTRFSYESRIYAPTDPDKRAAGMITRARNYFKFVRPITPAFSFLFMEVPILHAYDRDGSTSIADGKTKAAANPIFENQVYLELDITPPKTGWALSFPIMLSSTRFRTYAGDPNSAGWAQWVEVYPEIDYSVSKNLVLGIAYESGNLLNAQTSFDPSGTPEVGSGTAQLVLRSTF